MRPIESIGISTHFGTLKAPLNDSSGIPLLMSLTWDKKPLTMGYKREGDFPISIPWWALAAECHRKFLASGIYASRFNVISISA